MDFRHERIRRQTHRACCTCLSVAEYYDDDYICWKCKVPTKFMSTCDITADGLETTYWRLKRQRTEQQSARNPPQEM